MVNIFQLNKRFGEWAERTVYGYFKRNRNELGLTIFYFGSQRATRKKDKTDAPKRPDFIIMNNPTPRGGVSELHRNSTYFE
jgi:hypothetical protein